MGIFIPTVDKEAIDDGGGDGGGGDDDDDDDDDDGDEYTNMTSASCSFYSYIHLLLLPSPSPSFTMLIPGRRFHKQYYVFSKYAHSIALYGRDIDFTTYSFA